jgi:alkylation response protein AidB-like acyl-CoA dehydrogenase
MTVSHLSQDEERLIEAVRQFAQQHVAPRAVQIDQTGQFPWDIKDLLAQHAVFALPFPEEYGGLGASNLATVMAIEALSRYCATTGLLLAVQKFGAILLLLAGTEEQKRRYFPRLASGEWLVAFALTEADSGSDAAAIRTRAVRQGEKYMLNGAKRFISNGGIAQVNIVFAMTDPGRGRRGISAFIVEKDFPGFAVGRIEEKMGIKGSQTAELFFTECKVPADNLLGREGEGFQIAMMTLDRTRPSIGAQAVGIAQGALDLAVSSTKACRPLSRPLAENQGIQFMLAEMATKVEAARLLVYQVAEMMDQGRKDFRQYSAMAKLFASDTAMEVTNQTLQILGSEGALKGAPAERMLRDAKITQIYEGTNQIQHLVIARALLAAS